MGSNNERNHPRIQRLYYRIGEVAQMLDVEPSVLRHWETEFKTLRPSRTKSGQRVYSQKDIRKLEQIKQLLHERHFTTKGAIQELQRAGVEPREEGDPVLVQNRAMRQTLLHLRSELKDLLRDLRGEETT